MSGLLRCVGLSQGAREVAGMFVDAAFNFSGRLRWPLARDGEITPDYGLADANVGYHADFVGSAPSCRRAGRPADRGFLARSGHLSQPAGRCYDC